MLITDTLNKIAAGVPLTDPERVVVAVAALVLILMYFIVSRLPVKTVKKDVWKNVRNRNRKKAPPRSKDGKR